MNTWPRVDAVLNADGTATVTIAGATQGLTADNVEHARTKVAEIIAAKAAQLGRPLHAITHDPTGTWPIIVNPDGTITADDTTSTPQHRPLHTPTTLSASSGTYSPSVSHDEEGTEPEPDHPTRRELHGRHSFLTVTQVEQPAKQGWRGVATRLGLRMSPSAAERAERADTHAVSQHWPGPRTIVVANGKGGAGKTPTTVLLSAVFARYGGAGVVAWDSNQTRGTLGWRTEQGPHVATVLDLLPQAERLLGTGAQSADLAHFVHHQTSDRYDVLRSQPIQLAADQRVGPDDVDNLWNVMAKYYRLVIVDTGNDESDPVWLQAVEHADQIVVPTTTRADHAEAGALLLDALRARDEHSRRLADQAIAIVTQADPRATKADVEAIVSGYGDLAREVVTIPHDPAIVDGILHWDALRLTTQRAWLRAAAAVAHGL